ncbi:Importin subunit alpha-1a-like protein, partial [Drosera capensis]
INPQSDAAGLRLPTPVGLDNKCRDQRLTDGIVRLSFVSMRQHGFLQTLLLGNQRGCSCYWAWSCPNVCKASWFSARNCSSPGCLGSGEHCWNFERECRDVVLSNEALGALLTQFTNDVELSDGENRYLGCVKLLQTQAKATKAALPVLQQLVKFNDDEVLSEACWALSHLSDEIDESDGSSLAVTEAGFCPSLLKLLLSIVRQGQQTTALVAAGGGSGFGSGSADQKIEGKLNAKRGQLRPSD